MTIKNANQISTQPMPDDLKFAAKMWLELGTANGWSIEVVTNELGELGIALFKSHFFGKPPPHRKSYMAMAQDFMYEKPMQQWLKMLGSPLVNEVQLGLRKVTQSIPLPCETVLVQQLEENWDDVKKQYKVSATLAKRLTSESSGKANFWLLSYWFRDPQTILEFLGALVNLDSGALTKAGLGCFEAISECWKALLQSRESGVLELCFIDEIRTLDNQLEERHRQTYFLKDEFSSLGKRTAEAETAHAQKIATVLVEQNPNLYLSLPANKNGLWSRELREAQYRGRSHKDTQSQYALLPQLQESKFLQFVKKLEQVSNSVRRQSSDFYGHPYLRFDESASEFEPFWAGVELLFQLTLHLALPEKPSAQQNDFLGAIEARKKRSSWAYLANVLRPSEVIPLKYVFVTHEHGVAPGVVSPDISCLKKAQKAKKLAAQSAQNYVSIPTLLDKSFGADMWESPAGRPVPFVGEQVLSGILALSNSMPGVFQNFEFLKYGAVKEFQHNSASLFHSFENRFLLSGTSRLTWDLSLILPYRMCAARATPGVVFDSSSSPDSLEDIEVCDPQSSKQVQINLTFKPKGGGEFGALVEAVLKAFAASSSSFQAEFRANHENELFIESVEFEPVFSFDIDGRTISEAEWCTAKKTKTGYVLKDGSRFSSVEYERCLEIYFHRQKALLRFGKLRMRDLWKASHISRESADLKLSVEEYLSSLQTNLEGFTSTLSAHSEESFVSQLRDRGVFNTNKQLRGYQRNGIAWILSRFALGMGACLADEMGLGKTIQAACVLSFVRAMAQREHSTTSEVKCSIVVCPKSLVMNWERELMEWAPQLRIQCLETQELDTRADVVITTYARIRIRADEFSGIKWLCAVLDEAHQIKNHSTGQAQAAKKLNSTYRLAMTGTPLENHPRELWSLLDWLNEGWMGDLSHFESYTRSARSAREKALMLAPLRSMIGPVLLRRLKNDFAVALDLPDKLERTIDVELGSEQKALYEAVLLAALGAQASVGVFSKLETTSRYLKAILHAKQICNHPDNFLQGDEDQTLLQAEDLLPQKFRKKLAKRETNFESAEARSPKLQAFLDLLLELRETEGGILVFTQFKKAALLLVEAIQNLGCESWRDIPYFGSALSTNQRESMVSNFQSKCEFFSKSKGTNDEPDAPPLLLLSLKTGGVGLNLTGASHVIHYDRWWNPAVEAQATDRAHRFGQTRSVTVTQFRTLGTIEEGIDRMMRAKKLVANDFLAEASTEGVNESLRDESGFLNLVDPQGFFCRAPAASKARS